MGFQGVEVMFSPDFLKIFVEIKAMSLPYVLEL